MLSDFRLHDTGGSALCCCCDNRVKIHFRLRFLCLGNFLVLILKLGQIFHLPLLGLGSMLLVVDLDLAVEFCCISHFSSAIVFAVAFFSRLCCASLLRCSRLLPTVVASFLCCCRYSVVVTVQLGFPWCVKVADINFYACRVLREL